MTELAIENEIQVKGLTAPRLTPSDIDMSIVREHYHRVPETTTTLCSLVLENGYVVNGESACVSLENFDEELGKKIAYSNARDKIWALKGYLLAEVTWLNKGNS